jgi:hypothetical protein
MQWPEALELLGRGETVYLDGWPIAYLDAQFAPAGCLGGPEWPFTAFNGAPFRVILCGFGRGGPYTPTAADMASGSWRRGWSAKDLPSAVM